MTKLTRLMTELTRRLTIAAVCIAFMAPSAYGDLKGKMSEEAFARAGLHKLSAEELAALEAWIAGESAPPKAVEPAAPGPATPAVAVKSAPTKTAPAKPTPISAEPATATDRFGQEQVIKPIEADVPEQISARVVGEFRGWEGKTVFRLDNGQVWRQRVGGKYRSPRRNDPAVIIEKGRFGYYLKVVETGRSVGVKRLR